jgi:integrase
MYIAGGIGSKRLQVIMGHSSIQMTYDVYGHLFETDDGDMAGALESSLMR